VEASFTRPWSAGVAVFLEAHKWQTHGRFRDRAHGLLEIA
jgi:hypothetical protein